MPVRVFVLCQLKITCADIISKSEVGSCGMVISSRHTIVGKIKDGNNLQVVYMAPPLGTIDEGHIGEAARFEKHIRARGVYYTVDKSRREIIERLQGILGDE